MLRLFRRRRHFGPAFAADRPPAPPFNLPALPGSDKPGLADADLRQGKTTIVNLFASWCGPCRLEHPVLRDIADNAELKAMGVRLVGIAYKDDPGNASASSRRRAILTRRSASISRADWHRLGSDRRPRNLHHPRRRDDRLQIHRADHRTGDERHHPPGNEKDAALAFRRGSDERYAGWFFT